MKIVFVCGSLEPGRDGVGDYCWRMAAACREAGHEVALLAIHDGHAARAEQMRSGGIPILRLPRSEPWSTRVKVAAEFLAAQEPEWVSVQFVGYALDPRGMVHRWGARLAELLRGRRVQLCFHELWIGASTEYGLADRIVGAAQRLSIRGLVRCMRPAAVQTTSRVYQDLLAGIGVRAGRLQLPGNVPVAADARAALPPELEALGRDRAARRLAGVFGTIHPAWKAEPWLPEVCALAERDGRRLALVQFGEAGSAGRTIWDEMAAQYRARADFVSLGPCEPAVISAILQAMEFGVATSPWALIEKSGSTAAFLDHGRAVLVPRDDWKLRAGYTPEPAGHPLLCKSCTALWRALPRDATTAAAAERLPEIARNFVAALR